MDKSHSSSTNNKLYAPPLIVKVLIDKEISLILNSFNSLPGDPFGDGCDSNINEKQNSSDLWE